MENYLQNMPQELSKYGLCKTLYTRWETIRIKHVLTDVFVKKKIDINDFYLMLLNLDLDFPDYISFLINQLRKLYKITRKFDCDINSINKNISLFSNLDAYKSLNNVIVLDFDGVITKRSFKFLYDILYGKCKIIVCTANPVVTNDWFINHDFKVPFKIEACKGKKAKIKRLIEIKKRYDNVFYVDNEEIYLKYAYIFFIKTFHYCNGKIKPYTLNTKH